MLEKNDSESLSIRILMYSFNTSNYPWKTGYIAGYSENDKASTNNYMISG